MIYEYTPRSIHAAHAAQSFVQLLRAKLPDEVFQELDSLPMDYDAVGAWATKHRICAPCVIEAFAIYCNGGWTKHRDDVFAGFEWPRAPHAWYLAIERLNEQPVDRTAPKGYFADDAIAKSILHKTGARDADQATVDMVVGRRLGPIATDPSSESLRDFLERAEFHWRARGHMAERIGFRLAGSESEFPNLARDLDWLCRYLIGRETYQDIAGDQFSEASLDPSVVETAIGRLAKLIGIRRSRGRPAAKNRK